MYSVYAQTPELIPQTDTLIATIQSIDAQINVPLAGTLAGFALASTGFLLSTQSPMEKSFDEKQEQISQEKDSGRKLHLQNDLSSLSLQMETIQKGITNLVRAFFLFIANMLSLLLLFDSILQQVHISQIDNILQIFVETVPFLI